VTLAAVDLWVVGPWAWSYTIFPEWKRVRLDVTDRNAESLSTPRVDGQGLSSTSTFYVGIMENWYFKRYVDFLARGSQEPAEMKYLLGMVDGRRVFFSQRIDHPSIRAFLDDAGRFDDVVRFTEYTGDRLAVRVAAPVEGYLSFIDNWDPDWEATVNGQATAIERLFGTFKSVPVGAGNHAVRFVYRPIHLWTRAMP
jgi:hypothetical protein